MSGKIIVNFVPLGILSSIWMSPLYKSATTFAKGIPSPKPPYSLLRDSSTL